MILSVLLDVLLLLPRALSALIGLLPFGDFSLNDWIYTAFGYGCYVAGTAPVLIIFVSICGWCTVFSTLSIFKFIKNYVPVS